MNNHEEDNEPKDFIISEVDPSDIKELYQKKKSEIREELVEKVIEQEHVQAEMEYVKESRLLPLIKDVNIIIFVATDVEKRTVLRHLRPLRGTKSIIWSLVKIETYYVGCLGAYNVVLIICNKPGSALSDSISYASYDALPFWKPKLVILCGIACGLDENVQHIGDVLISDQIILYEIERIGKKIIPRGPHPETSKNLINIFKSESNWKYRIDQKINTIIAENKATRKRHAKYRFIEILIDKISDITNKYKKYRLADNINARKRFGAILTGEKLIDSKPFRKQLLKKFPKAIGAEMEAAGLYASIKRYAEINHQIVHWIVVKGICDWGFDKIKDFQEIAADSAISLISRVFSNKYSFSQLKITPDCMKT